MSVASNLFLIMKKFAEVFAPTSLVITRSVERHSPEAGGAGGERLVLAHDQK